MFWVILIIVAIIIVFAFSVSSGSENKDTTNRINEYGKYTDDKYELYPIHQMLLDLPDGEYDVSVFSVYNRKGYSHPIEVRKQDNNQVVGYLHDDADLYNAIESGTGFVFAPLFIKQINNDRLAYIYIEKKILGNKKHANASIDDCEPDVDDILLDLEEYTLTENFIELPIRGINFRNLTDANIGSFDGYIMPDKENKHDKYAIGVYGSDDTHFGFIEKGQKFLCDKIEEGNGFINAKLDVRTFIEDETGKVRFQGTVTINKEDLV